MIQELTSVKITEIDLDFVKGYLKVDYEDEDKLIVTMMMAARSHIETILGYKITDRFATVEDIPGEFTIAFLMLVAHWFDQRQMQTVGTLGKEMAYAVDAIVEAHMDHTKEYDPNETDTGNILV